MPGAVRARGSKTIVAGLAVLAAALAVGPATASADWSGDAKGDLLATGSDGALLLYRGDGAGRVVPGQAIGSGWGEFTALLATEFSGDGRPDLLARRSDGGLLMYRGNGSGGFVTGTGEVVGSGWQGFTGLLAPGDFSGDGKADILARQSRPRRVDRRRPYVVRLRLRRPAGSEGRVYARVFFRRPGTRKLRHKTVARRFVMCA